MRFWSLVLCVSACTPGELPERIPLQDPVTWVNPADAEDTDPTPDVVAVTLRASHQTYVIDGEEIDGYAYNGQNPGPTLRLQVGDTLNATLINDLDVPTTIHWHGISVPYAMDGVTWTEAPVAPGEQFEYSFQVNQAGTFWYHPHFDTERQVDLGLYGLVIVEDPDAPKPDREVLLVLDSWGDHVPDPNHRHFGTIRDWTVNGLLNPQIPVESGEVIHMRVLNASNIGYLSLTGSFNVIAGDQGWVSDPGPKEHVIMGPGDRIETEWTVGPDPLTLSTQPYAMHGGGAYGDTVELASLIPTGTQSAPDALTWPSLQGVPSDDGAPDIVYVFQGDDSSGVWMINGEVFPDITMETLALGQDAIVEVRNMSAVEHPFHLHGFHFEVLSINDEPSVHKRIEDTLNIRIRQRVRLKITADNPGYWMTHCHILPHAYGGMMTVLHVLEE